MNAEIQRKRAQQTVASLLNEMVHLLDAERDAFEDFVKANGDYPPRGWNHSSRTKQYRLQEEIDRHIDSTICLRDRGNFLEMVALMPWEAFQARAEFMAEVSKLRA